MGKLVKIVKDDSGAALITTFALVAVMAAVLTPMMGLSTMVTGDLHRHLQRQQSEAYLNSAEIYVGRHLQDKHFDLSITRLMEQLNQPFHHRFSLDNGHMTITVFDHSGCLNLSAYGHGSIQTAFDQLLESQYTIDTRFSDVQDWLLMRSYQGLPLLSLAELKTAKLLSHNDITALAGESCAFPAEDIIAVNVNSLSSEDAWKVQMVLPDLTEEEASAIISGIITQRPSTGFQSLEDIDEIYKSVTNTTIAAEYRSRLALKPVIYGAFMTVYQSEQQYSRLSYFAVEEQDIILLGRENTRYFTSHISGKEITVKGGRQ